MIRFFRQIHTPGPLLGSLRAISSMTGGNTSANAVEQSAPISEMNSPSAGTSSAMATAGESQVEIGINRSSLMLLTRHDDQQSAEDKFTGQGTSLNVAHLFDAGPHHLDDDKELQRIAKQDAHGDHQFDRLCQADKGEGGGGGGGDWGFRSYKGNRVAHMESPRLRVRLPPTCSPHLR